jgi:hypothetical protein
VRVFPPSDTLSVFTEAYDDAPKPPGDVTMSASILSLDGSVAHGDPGVRGSLKENADGAYRYTAQILLNAVPPGDYLLRITAARAAGGAAAHRDVPLRVR